MNREEYLKMRENEDSAKCDLANASYAITQGRYKDAYMECEAAQRKLKEIIAEFDAKE